MNEKIHRHLDGEIGPESFDGDDRSEVDAWARMLEAFRGSAPPAGAAPAWLEDRVMAEIEALPEAGVLRRVWGWLVRPAPVRISPLTAGLVAAAFAAVIALPGRSRPGDPDPTGSVAATRGGDSGTESVVYVQFILDAPDARTVAVAGDFSDWEPTFTLDDPDGDGIWTGRIPVRPGVHAYMFLVDDARWLTDPNAERYQDDGFGNRNAVLAVASGA